MPSLSETQIEKLEAAIDIMGNQTRLANAIGVSQPAIAKWLTGVCRYTADNALKIELATQGQIGREELCPDIFDGFERK